MILSENNKHVDYVDYSFVSSSETYIYIYIYPYIRIRINAQLRSFEATLSVHSSKVI